MGFSGCAALHNKVCGLSYPAVHTVFGGLYTFSYMDSGGGFLPACAAFLFYKGVFYGELKRGHGADGAYHNGEAFFAHKLNKVGDDYHYAAGKRYGAKFRGTQLSWFKAFDTIYEQEKRNGDIGGGEYCHKAA